MWKWKLEAEAVETVKFFLWKRKRFNERVLLKLINLHCLYSALNPRLSTLPSVTKRRVKDRFVDVMSVRSTTPRRVPTSAALSKT